MKKRIAIAELCKGVHFVDLAESFQTHINLQNLASIQPRTSLVKCARSPRTDPPGFAGVSGEISAKFRQNLAKISLITNCRLYRRRSLQVM